MKLFSLGALVVAPVLAADEKCLLPVDIMILQDTTGSFLHNLPNVAAVLPELVKKVSIQNPGSWFGAASFKDKPYRDLGEPEDHCYTLASPLTAHTEDFVKAYSKLYASGGGDLPEAQLQALINLMDEDDVRWRKLSTNFLNTRYRRNKTTLNLATETGARLVIMSTDAAPHYPDDYEFYNGNRPDEPMANEPRPPKFMPPFPNSRVGITPDVQCRVYNYPDMAQAAATIKAHNTHVVFLVPEAEHDALSEWRTFNTKYLGQPESFVQYIKHDSSDVVDVVLKAMKEVSEYVCNPPTTTSTTTVTPSATTAATTATTTAATTSTTTTTATTTPATTVTTTAATTATTTPVTTATTSPVTTTTTTVDTTATTVTTTPVNTATTATTATTASTTSDAVVTTAGTTESTSVTATTLVSTTPGSETTVRPTKPHPTHPTHSTTPECSTTHECPTTPECPVCPPGVLPEPCHSGHCPCPCPEVVVKLRHRPAKLLFRLENNI